jgi:8-oxo-dGTP pyrophosphatase MutT (NUDIX family)
VDGSWSLSGGCLDEGQTLPAVAAREALEEAGITVDPADLARQRRARQVRPDRLARHEQPSPDIVSYISNALHTCARNDAFSLVRW